MGVRFTALIISAAVCLSGPPHAMAAPFIPKDDAQILEQLRTQAADPVLRELRQLRIRLADNPDDLQLATPLARRYIEYGRAEADPRYYGYAEAVLKPWLNNADPPIAVLLLRATLRQSRHDFSGALRDLSKILKTNPTNAQAWLTKAALEQVQGNYAEAKKSCIKLLRLASELTAAICVSGVGSYTGQVDKSYRLLQEIFARYPQTNAAEKLWALTSLAEMAARLGNAQAAESHFRQALKMGVRDSYLLGAYADFLLDQGRPAEVVNLLKDEIRADGLLLRLTLAEKLLSSDNLSEHIEALRARFAASRLRGDTVHRREEARFILHLLNRSQEALRLAQENWQVQRESADTRILLEAAIAAKNRSAAQPVLDWLSQIRLEDVQLQGLRQNPLFSSIQGQNAAYRQEGRRLTSNVIYSLRRSHEQRENRTAVLCRF